MERIMYGPAEQAVAIVATHLQEKGHYLTDHGLTVLCATAVHWEHMTATVGEMPRVSQLLAFMLDEILYA